MGNSRMKNDIDTSELEKYPKEILKVALSNMKEQRNINDNDFEFTGIGSSE